MPKDTIDTSHKDIEVSLEATRARYSNTHSGVLAVALSMLSNDLSMVAIKEAGRIIHIACRTEIGFLDAFGHRSRDQLLRACESNAEVDRLSDRSSDQSSDRLSLAPISRLEVYASRQFTTAELGDAIRCGFMLLNAFDRDTLSPECTTENEFA